MKKYVFVFVLFSMRLALSQELPVELPNLSPQSPSAYQFTKYGEINVNESTGTINPSIPLYSYKAGNIEIPIALSYGGNGVKVAQEPTWVGINWNLMPGGVITRQVRDQPDEKTDLNDKKFYSEAQLNNLDGYGDNISNPYSNFYNTPGTAWYDELNEITNVSVVDSEADIFNYNFLGYSGSFYLDENLVPHLLNYNKELKIQFLADPNNINHTNKSTIIITTPDGNKYSFGGANASESSKTYTNAGAGSFVGIDHAQNAFYLYLIESYAGDKINFIYEQVKYDSIYNGYVMDKYEHLSKRKYIFPSCATPYTYSGLKNITQLIQSRVVLTKITSDFNDNYIEFSSSLLMGRKRKLNSIYVKDVNNSLLKKFTFEYLTLNSETEAEDNKYFLEQVNFHDKNELEIYDYKLDYNNPNSLPTKWSFSKDHNGYYNGGYNTASTLLPQDDRFLNTIVLANRETNAQTIKYGSLNKITYPTGGYSIFDYEVPIKDYNIGVDEYFLNVYHRAPDRDYTSDYEDVLYYEQDDTFSFNGGDEIEVDLLIETTGSLTHNSISIFAVEGINGAQHELYNFSNLENPENTPQSFNEHATLTIPTTGTYTFKLVFNAHSTINNSNTVNVNAHFHIDNYEYLIPVYYPSLRIKQISSYASSSDLPIVKRFYYNGIRNLDEENSILTAAPVYVNTTALALTTCPGDPIAYLNLSTSALNSVYVDDSQKILYPVVTTSYGGDNFEQGGKESIFRVYPEETTYEYFGTTVNNGELLDVNIPYTTTGFSDANSTLLNERIVSYNNVNDTFKILKETSYVYNVLQGTHKMANIKTAIVTNGVVNHDIRKYNLTFYNIYSKKNVLKNIITKEYFSDFSQDTIVTTQTNEYGTYVDRPSSVKTLDSKGLEKEDKYFYPIDVTAENEGLTSLEESKILQMHDQNKIDMPYLVKNYYDQEFKSSRLTVFSDEWCTGKIWPKTIKTKKDSTASFIERINFQDYNCFGNVENVSLKDGAVTKYIYNSNQQVIAKIENYNVADIDDSIPTNSPCYYQETYPTSLVTVYEYDSNNGNLISTQDAKCRKTFFEYDNFNHVQQIKDSEGNILSANNYKYKDQ